MAENPKAINKKNLISKICFVKFGLSLEEAKNDFEKDLIEFQKNTASEDISRQTINNWVQKNINPSRKKAFSFLLGYMNEIDVFHLSAEQKKVNRQVTTFLETTINSRQQNNNKVQRNKIYRNRSDNIIIGISDKKTSLHEIYKKISGLYYSYRYRFGSSNDEPISIEILKVYLKQKDLRFQHWYIRNNHELTSYDGIILPVGKTLWFIGISEGNTDRFRVLQFRDEAISDPKYDHTMWGIAMSDVPDPGAQDPAACRILLEKTEDKVENFQNFLKQKVRHISAEKFQHPLKQAICRLIDNSETCYSVPNTTSPISGQHGEKLSDNILRVHHETVNSFARDLYNLKSKP